MGIIGIACPDKSPLLSCVSLMGAAIARSNSVVMVPSEKYPLLALDLYQVKLILDLVNHKLIDDRSLKQVIFLEGLSTSYPAQETIFLSILWNIKMLMQCGTLDPKKGPNLLSTLQQVKKKYIIQLIDPATTSWIKVVDMLSKAPPHNTHPTHYSPKLDF